MRRRGRGGGRGGRALHGRLLREALERGARATLRVTGGSMWPLLAAGDRVDLGTPRPKELRPGAVVCVERGSDLVVHRIVAVRGGRIRTRGDRSLVGDAWLPLERVVGRVVGIERRGWRKALRLLPPASGLWRRIAAFRGLQGPSRLAPEGRRV